MSKLYPRCKNVIVVGLILFIHTSPAEEDSTYYMSNYCGQNFNMSQRNLHEIVLKLTSTDNFWSNADCQMDIITSNDHILSFKILSITLQDCNDGITLYGESTNISDALSATKMCSSNSDVFITPGFKGTVTFSSNGDNNNGGFRILITSFYIRNGDTCRTGYFKCGNGRCVKSEELYCNSRDNCGDNSDEYDECDEEENDSNWWIPIPCSIGAFFLLCCIWSHLKKKKAQQAAARSKANAAPPARPATQTQITATERTEPGTQRKELGTARSTQTTPLPPTEPSAPDIYSVTAPPSTNFSTPAILNSTVFPRTTYPVPSAVMPSDIPLCSPPAYNTVVSPSTHLPNVSG